MAGDVEQRFDRRRKAAHAAADHDQRDRAERQEQHRLKGVDPGRAAHAAEEHVAHDDQRDDRAAEPVRNEAAGDRAQRGAAAHHADDDVGHEQRRLHGEDHRADVPALPAIAKHLHRRHEAVAPAERPHARADEEERQRNHERRRRGHQAEGDDAVGEGVAGGAEDRERRHVRAEERQQEHHRAERAAGEEVVLRFVIRRPAMPEREDADVEDDGEIGEDEDRGNQRRRPPRRLVLEMARPRHARQRPHQQRRGEAVGAVIRQPDRQEAKDAAARRAPEPDVLVQRVERDDGRAARCSDAFSNASCESQESSKTGNCAA